MTVVLRIRRLAVLAACCIAVVALVAACGDSSSSNSAGNPNIKVPSAAIAVVGTKAVPKSEFDALLQEYQDSTYKANKQPVPKQGSTQYQSDVQKVVSYLVQKSELEQEAAKRGITVSKADVDKKIKQDVLQFFKGKQALLLAAMKKQGVSMAEFRQTVAFSSSSPSWSPTLTKGNKVTEAQVKKYYDQNKASQFTKPESAPDRAHPREDEGAGRLALQETAERCRLRQAREEVLDRHGLCQAGRQARAPGPRTLSSSPFDRSPSRSRRTRSRSRSTRSSAGTSSSRYGPVVPAVVTPYAEGQGDDRDRPAVGRRTTRP